MEAAQVADGANRDSVGRTLWRGLRLILLIALVSALALAAGAAFVRGGGSSSADAARLLGERLGVAFGMAFVAGTLATAGLTMLIAGLRSFSGLPGRTHLARFELPAVVLTLLVFALSWAGFGGALRGLLLVVATGLLGVGLVSGAAASCKALIRRQH